MTGLRDLSDLLRGMAPVLHPQRFVFATTTDAELARRAQARMTFIENEGITLILDPDAARTLGLEAVFPCRMITLNITSSLEAIGFIAAVSAELTRIGIGANPVAGFFHDHLFIAEEQAEEALAALCALAAKTSGRVAFPP